MQLALLIIRKNSPRAHDSEEDENYDREHLASLLLAHERMGAQV